MLTGQISMYMYIPLVHSKRAIVEALLKDTLASRTLLLADSSTYDHLHKTLFELPYKICIYPFT